MERDCPPATVDMTPECLAQRLEQWREIEEAAAKAAMAAPCLTELRPSPRVRLLIYRANSLRSLADAFQARLLADLCSPWDDEDPPHLH